MLPPDTMIWPNTVWNRRWSQLILILMEVLISTHVNLCQSRHNVFTWYYMRLGTMLHELAKAQRSCNDTVKPPAILVDMYITEVRGVRYKPWDWRSDFLQRMHYVRDARGPYPFHCMYSVTDHNCSLIPFCFCLQGSFIAQCLQAIDTSWLAEQVKHTSFTYSWESGNLAIVLDNDYCNHSVQLESRARPCPFSREPNVYDVWERR